MPSSARVGCPIRPGEIVSYTADDKDPWSYIWFGFRGSLASRFDTLDDILHPNGDIFIEAKNYPSSLIEERLTATLFRLYCNLFEKDSSPNYVNKVITHINARHMDELRIGDIAESLHLNRKYLARIFKSRTGYTMQEYLIKKRLTEGRKFLEKGYNVGVVSELCGYTDTFAFSKAFKAHFGKSPKNYKKTGKV